jgi:hypothetical protein
MTCSNKQEMYCWLLHGQFLVYLREHTVQTRHMSAVEQGASGVIQTKGMTMYSQSDYSTPLHNNASDQGAAAAGYPPPGVEGGEFESVITRHVPQNHSAGTVCEMLVK